MRPLTKETVEMVRRGLLESDWCGFSKRDTVNQLCDLALKGLTVPEAPKISVQLARYDMNCYEDDPAVRPERSPYGSWVRFDDVVQAERQLPQEKP